jgi:hypothetical protein
VGASLHLPSRGRLGLRRKNLKVKTHIIEKTDEKRMKNASPA